MIKLTEVKAEEVFELLIPENKEELKNYVAIEGVDEEMKRRFMSHGSTFRCDDDFMKVRTISELKRLKYFKITPGDEIERPPCFYCDGTTDLDCGLCSFEDECYLDCSLCSFEDECYPRGCIVCKQADECKDKK